MTGQYLSNLAALVLASESTHAADSGSVAIERACNSLHGHLDSMIGLRGFHVLIGRALYLSRETYEWLGVITLSPDSPGCSLRGSDEAAAMAGSNQESVAGFTLLLSNIIWLLAAFIGADLTTRFVEGAWPGLEIDRDKLRKELANAQ